MGLEQQPRPTRGCSVFWGGSWLRNLAGVGEPQDGKDVAYGAGGESSWG